MKKTREELDKELLVFEKATDVDKVIIPTAEGAAEGVKPEGETTPKPEDKPIQQAPKEDDKLVETLKAQVAEKDAKLAELQARLDRQSGEFGGNLDKLRNQVREISEAYTALKQQHDALQEKAKQPPAPPAKVVSDAMRNTFPEDADAIEQTIASLRAELATVKKMGEEGSTRAQNAEQSSVKLLETRFSESLYGAVPDFNSINSDPRWAAFVDKPDAYGRTLRPDLEAAWGQFNPKPLIAAVAEYKASLGAVTTTPTAEEIAAKAKAEADKKAKLNAEAAPSPSAGSQVRKNEAEEASKARQARMANYKAKFARDFTSITPQEMEQNRADSAEELKQKLSRVSSS
jgi:hypothetical protein